MPSQRSSRHATIAKAVDKLLMAGRCLSGDFFAHASYRVTGTAAMTGQAAGVAAALSVQGDKPVADLAWEPVEKVLAENGWLERDP